jgi:hypothetical protein
MRSMVAGLRCADGGSCGATHHTRAAASRWWRIALAPGFVGPRQHARSPDTHGFSLSLSLSQKHTQRWGRPPNRTPERSQTLPNDRRVQTMALESVFAIANLLFPGLSSFARRLLSGATPSAGATFCYDKVWLVAAHAGSVASARTEQGSGDSAPSVSPGVLHRSTTSCSTPQDVSLDHRVDNPEGWWVMSSYAGPQCWSYSRLQTADEESCSLVGSVSYADTALLNAWSRIRASNCYSTAWAVG